MVETAGTKLRRARTQRHLSLEDAARATKIQLARLRDLENDDYSNFANLAYARGFLVAYGKYLHLDTRPYMDAFADASTFGLEDYQYWSDRPVAEYRAPQRAWRKRRRTASVRQVVALVASFVVLAAAVFGFYVYVNYKRLGNLGTLVERQSPSPAAPAAAADAPKPAALPVASTPAPSASIAPVEVTPNPEETRAAAASALASDQNEVSPTALLTQLSLPAVKAPGDPNSPLASPVPGALARPKDKSVLPALPVDGSKPQTVSNDTRH